MTRPRCTGRAREVRSMWLFGLEGEELRESARCLRPTGHRGDCHRTAPRALPPPWRSVNLYRYIPIV